MNNRDCKDAAFIVILTLFFQMVYLIPLKTPENQRFSDAFWGGGQKGILRRKGFIFEERWNLHITGIPYQYALAMWCKIIMTRSKLKNVNLKSRNNENCANYKKLNFCILTFLSCNGKIWKKIKPSFSKV